MTYIDVDKSRVFETVKKDALAIGLLNPFCRTQKDRLIARFNGKRNEDIASDYGVSVSAVKQSHMSTQRNLGVPRQYSSSLLACFNFGMHISVNADDINRFSRLTPNQKKILNLKLAHKDSKVLAYLEGCSESNVKQILRGAEKVLGTANGLHSTFKYAACAVLVGDVDMPNTKVIVSDGEALEALIISDCPLERVHEAIAEYYSPSRD